MPKFDIPHKAVGALCAGLIAFVLLFLASFFGATSDLKPRQLKIGVTGFEMAVDRVVEKLNASHGAVHPIIYEHEHAAIEHLKNRDLVAVFSFQKGPHLLEFKDPKFYLNGANGEIYEMIFSKIAANMQPHIPKKIEIVVLNPLPNNDPAGKRPFFIGFPIILGSMLLGIALALMVQFDPQKRKIALPVMVLFSIALTGLMQLIYLTGFGFGAGNWFLLWCITALTAFAVSSTLYGCYALFWLPGIGLGVVAILMIGLPTSLLPLNFLVGFWREVGAYLPTYAGLEAINNLVYNHGAPLHHHLIILMVYAVAGAATALFGMLCCKKKNCS